jgi:ureidoglycolate hydrolase
MTSFQNKPIIFKQLPAQLIAPENFQPYGQVIYPTPDGKRYDLDDAQLIFGGKPHFYILHLLNQGRKFHHLARHLQCTQCLGSLGGKDWFMAVAPVSAPSEIDLDQLRAFLIPGNCFIKLAAGTWHAGPHFDDEFIDFYNLELTDTNINDYHACNLKALYGWEFEIVRE